MELKPKFDHKNTEKNKYKKWIDSRVFNADVASNKTPYTIILPPPNVTGKLHLGHAWDTTLQDILIRYKKMNGFETLWIPGMDHAGIATQAKVEERLREENISKYDLGREKFIEKSFLWKEEYASFIREQWEMLGLALDYEQEKFTLDEDVSRSVRKVFVDLYNKDLIYQGYRITNWDPKAKTALSDIEVIHKEVEGNLYYLNYQVVGTSEYLIVATTRPETIFADIAVAIHPEDERYIHLHNKKVIIPGTDQEIDIILDESVEIEFGTGAVKITPAHDINDYEVGKRHKLKMPICLNLDGSMNKLCGSYENLDRFECRKLLIKNLSENNLVTKIETHVHNVGHSERTGVIVEPLLSKQWYVKMDVLANQSMEFQKTNDKINFVPERFENTFSTWMENIQDWCISRQLWWGHQIPVWYHNDTKEMYVSEKAPVDIENWTQDPDVLDTWFSSALWPFSTTIWSDNKEKLSRFFPTDVLVTGYDIIFFWVSRMIFQSLEFTEQKPFSDVLIHGLIRGEDGRKMSKSLGNGIDPIDVIDTHGADSLRFFLTTNSAPGQDLRYSQEKLDSSWNFINKIWNISRFVLMNTENVDITNLNTNYFDSADHYIINKLNQTINTVNTMMDKYEFGEVSRSIYNFIWEDFASWYVEVSKNYLSMEDSPLKLNRQIILKIILIDIIKMMHPFCPFVTDEIYTQIENIDSVMLTSWPKVKDVSLDKEAINKFMIIKEIIINLRNLKAENDIKPSKLVDIIIESEIKFEQSDLDILQTIGKVNEIQHNVDMKNIEVISLVLNKITIHVKSEGLIDNNLKIDKLIETINELSKEINRSLKMLSNEKFVERAPQNKIEQEIEKANEYISQYEITQDLLNNFDKKLDDNIEITELNNIINKIKEYYAKNN